jgi:hypothetical protein
MYPDQSLGRQLLDRLELRQTQDRLATVNVFVEQPGLTESELVDAIGASGASVHRRTVQRLRHIVLSGVGSWARWNVCGPTWVCWQCGRAVGSARDQGCVNSFLARDFLPVDLGGYCSDCQMTLAEAPDNQRRAGRSPLANRRTTLIAIGALYENDNLMRELLGSNRRLAGRDFVVANLAENPDGGPTSVQRRLAEELPFAPTLRTIKRYSRLLRSPKAQMLFSSVGSIGWTCLGCATWGSATDLDELRADAPAGFCPTDVRGLCFNCRDRVDGSCPKEDK